MPYQWQNSYSDEKPTAKASNLGSRVQVGLPWASDIGSENWKVVQAKEDTCMKVGFCFPLDIGLEEYSRRFVLC